VVVAAEISAAQRGPGRNLNDFVETIGRVRFFITRRGGAYLEIVKAHGGDGGPGWSRDV